MVANLPYNIGTALLLKWLGGEWPPWWRSLTLMFQKEVAERIVAQAGSDAYGRLSVAAQWRCAAADRDDDQPLGVRASAQGDLGGGPHRSRPSSREGVSPRILERLTEAAFGQRRKMLRSSLKPMPGALDAAESLGIDLQRRAETLSVDEWVKLARLSPA